MARTGQNITLRKDGRWEGRYIKGYQDGKAVYAYVYGRSFEEACQKKAEAQRERRACTNNFNDCVFSDLTESFLKQKKYQVKESTYAHYCYIINKHILPYFSNCSITEISSLLIEDYVTDLKKWNNLDSMPFLNELIDVVTNCRQYTYEELRSIEEEIKVQTNALKTYTNNNSVERATSTANRIVILLDQREEEIDKIENVL